MCTYVVSALSETWFYSLSYKYLFDTGFGLLNHCITLVYISDIHLLLNFTPLSTDVSYYNSVFTEQTTIYWPRKYLVWLKYFGQDMWYIPFVNLH